MGEFLILASMAVGITAFIALIRPLPRIYLPTRKRAIYLLVSSFLMFGLGGSMLPDLPDSEQIVRHDEVDDESGLSYDTEREDDPGLKSKESKIEKQSEHVELHEIMMEWNTERDNYNDPAKFVFSLWENRTIRTTGLVFEKKTAPSMDGTTLESYVYFHNGGGDKDLIDGVWKWTGYNRGVYAKFDNEFDIESIISDKFLTVACTGVRPQYDKESGTFFGIELQNCKSEKAPE